MIGTKYLSLEDRVRAGLRVLLGILLISPFLVWLARVQAWAPVAFADWAKPLRVALVQASLSAVLSMIAGFFLCLGYLSWQRGRALAEMSLLVPNMIPPLFLALGFMNLASSVSALRYGIGAVVAAHVLLNAGLVAVALNGLLLTRLGAAAEATWLMGGSRTQFWRQVAWPELRSELACLFLFIFSVCFTSFSLPVLLSQDRAATLEVAIFDSIRMEGRWDKALLLAGLQSLVLFTLAWLLPQPFWPRRATRRNLAFIASRHLKLTVFLPALVLLCGWLAGLWRGFGAITDMGIGSSFLQALLATVALGLGVGLMHLLLFLCIAYVSPNARLSRFLNGYLAPSPVITGFALLLWPGEGDIWNLLKLILALTLISLPLLYRWMVHGALAGLSAQVRVARSLGASWAMILFEVVWPQAAPAISRASGLAALWASGDFALASILAEDVETLPLLMEGLIAGYRFEAAQVLMLPLLVVGLGLYVLFVKMGEYVTR